VFRANYADTVARRIGYLTRPEAKLQ